MVLRSLVTTIHGDLYGNGREGWLKRIGTFIDNFEGAEEERAEQENERHQSNTTRLNIIMAIVAIVGVIVTGIGIWVTVLLARHAEINFPLPIHATHQTEQVVAQDFEHYLRADQ